MTKRVRFSDISIQRIKERLGTPVNWFPYPAIISFFLVFLFTEFLLFSLNYRIFSKADILAFPSEKEYEGSIWISLSPEKDNLLVMTDDKNTFHWSLDYEGQTSEDQSSEDRSNLKSFVEYLKFRKFELLRSVGLSNFAISNQLSVVIAADQKLRFIHIRSILYALAEAGINRYAFETSQAITDPRLKQFESHVENKK